MRILRIIDGDDKKREISYSFSITTNVFVSTDTKSRKWDSLNHRGRRYCCCNFRCNAVPRSWYFYCCEYQRNAHMKPLNVSLSALRNGWERLPCSLQYSLPNWCIRCEVLPWWVQVCPERRECILWQGERSIGANNEWIIDSMCYPI